MAKKKSYSYKIAGNDVHSACFAEARCIIFNFSRQSEEQSVDFSHDGLYSREGNRNRKECGIL